jgi:hypothetical protein
LSIQYNKTIYDFTSANNPWGIGLGIQTLLNNKTKFKPKIVNENFGTLSLAIGFILV